MGRGELLGGLRATSAAVALGAVVALSLLVSASAQASRSNCTIKGTSADDRLVGTRESDVICGRGGNDTLIGRGGKDELRGATGNDSLEGGKGADQLLGDDGDDSVEGGDGDDRLSGGDGDDGLDGHSGEDLIFGEGGDDQIAGGDDADAVDGGEGADGIDGGPGEDRLTAAAGDDGVYGGDGNDRLFGGDGDDRLDGQAGEDRIDAGPGLNVCVPGGPGDVLADNCVDSTPPTISGVDISPDEIDTSAEPGQVQLHMRGADDLSGLASATLTFDTPGDDQRGEWTLDAYDGNDPDRQGTLDGYVYLGQLTGEGDWDLVGASIKDRAGNEAVIDREDLDAIGAPTSFHQSGGLDETAPEILDWSVTPRSIDTSTGSARVTVDMEVSDAQSGVGQAGPTFYMQPNVGVGPDGHLISGTRQEGVWRATYDVPRWTRKGEIPVRIEIYDRAGNGTVIDAGAVDQAGDGDTTPPALADVQITPQLFSTVGSDQTVQLRFHLQDARAGVSQGGTGTVGVVLGGAGGPKFLMASPDFGAGGWTATDGWWSVNYVVPRFSSAGTWTISNVYLTDDVGNMSTLTLGDLTSRGFPTSFSNQPG